MSESTVPMPKPVTAPRLLSDYKILSFDIYGTLIEYKGHILEAFRPLMSRLPSSSPYLNPEPLSHDIPNAATVGDIEFLKLFQKEEDTIKLETPLPRFDEILKLIWTRIAARLNVETTDEEASSFGSQRTIASWPVFPGTIEALQKLTRYKLVALSNIDRYAWEVTSKSASSLFQDNVDWWKVFTAEDFGEDVKKADDAKLETLVDYVQKEGLSKEDVLHVAQSLGHDHAPAKRLGVASVFLTGDGPRWGKEAESKMAVEKELVGYAWRCKDLQEFATLVEKAHE